jgi:Ca2+-binding EF-hand superfamily protein
MRARVEGVTAMSRRCAGSIAAIVQCLFLVSCQAGLGGSPAQPATGRLPYSDEFKRIDSANNGRITMEQAVAYYHKRFMELDKNRDGFLDMSELDASLPLMDATSGKELVTRLDRNSDGRISEAEFMVIVNWLFQLSSNPTEMKLKDAQGS